MNSTPLYLADTRVFCARESKIEKFCPWIPMLKSPSTTFKGALTGVSVLIFSATY